MLSPRWMQPLLFWIVTVMGSRGARLMVLWKGTMPRHAAKAVTVSLIQLRRKCSFFFNAVLCFNGKQLVRCITQTCKDTVCLHNLSLSAHPYEKLTG